MTFSLNELKELITFAKQNGIDSLKVQDIEVKFSTGSSLYSNATHTPTAQELKYTKHTGVNEEPSDEDLLFGSV